MKKLLAILFLSISIVPAQISVKTFTTEKAPVYSYPSKDSLTSNFIGMFEDIIVIEAISGFYGIESVGFIEQNKVRKNEELLQLEKEFNSEKHKDFLTRIKNSNIRAIKKPKTSEIKTQEQSEYTPTKNPTIRKTNTPVSSRCTATTKKGTRCKRNANPGSNYCWQHGG